MIGQMDGQIPSKVLSQNWRENTGSKNLDCSENLSLEVLFFNKH